MGNAWGGGGWQPAPTMEVGPDADWVVDGPAPDDPTVRLWTTRRLPFATDQSEAQKAMVARVMPRLARLQGGEDERLEAVFISEAAAGRQPDTENITLYNFGSAGFRNAPAGAVSFERGFAAAPAPPALLDGDARFHHEWSLVGAQAPPRLWAAIEPVATWSDVPLLLRGDIGIDSWLALREHPELIEVSTELDPGEHFLIAIDIAVPRTVRLSAVHLVKGIVDGSVAALQRADGLDEAIVKRLLRRGWARPMTAERLTELATAIPPEPVFPRAPFNRNGLDPCDEGCVAGILRLTKGDGPGLVMTGHVARVRPNPGVRWAE
jgi:hypothetical protein